MQQIQFLCVSEFTYTYNLLVFVQRQWFSLLAHSVDEVMISEWGIWKAQFRSEASVVLIGAV